MYICYMGGFNKPGNLEYDFHTNMEDTNDLQTGLHITSSNVIPSKIIISGSKAQKIDILAPYQGIYPTLAGLTNGDKWCIFTKIKSTCKIQIGSQNAGFKEVSSLPNFESKVFVFTIINTPIYIGIKASNDTGYIILDDLYYYNLTKIYGSGNEPSQVEMETILSN